ncbi:ABC transporter permease [Halarchaeum grantii]|uniref:ABC transporter permease n=1 Tax=Halarchaeum grantii TaxID=1193105 RepID=A0A830F8U5_9EURY|nr:sugar ABC transporter permease [Halarchaeum grantii]GGL30546.1 ABC transporter permease [Halarchaeum grantii]
MSTETDAPSDGVRQGSAGPLTLAARRVENLGEAGFAYLLLVPAIAILLIIAVWPLFETLKMSLHADALLTNNQVGEFVGLQNYRRLLTGELDPLLVRPFFDLSQPFQSALTVTLLFTVVSVFFETIIGLGQALVLDQDFRGRRWVRVAVILPWAVPIVIQGMIFYLLFQPQIGFLTAPLQSIGLFSSTPLSNSVDSFIIVTVADVWKTSAFMALIILAGLQSIDRQLYDVAKVAGASKWQQFKLITFPLVLPSIIVAMLFRTIAAMRVYGIIETVSSCSTVPSLSCMVVSSFSQHRYGSAATLAFVTAFIIALFVSVYIIKFADSGDL